MICKQAIAWIYGYVKQDFYFTFWGWLIGLVLSLLVSVFFKSRILILNRNLLSLFVFYQLCIPDWPIFNRDPVQWLTKVGQSNAPVAAAKTAPTKESKDSKKEKKTK